MEPMKFTERHSCSNCQANIRIKFNRILKERPTVPQDHKFCVHGEPLLAECDPVWSSRCNDGSERYILAERHLREAANAAQQRHGGAATPDTPTFDKS